MQLHWIRIEDVPRSGGGSRPSGLGTTEACGDTPRVMLGCPLAGILEDEVIDATDVLAETVAKYVGSPEFSNLPRKWKTSMSGCVDHCTGHEINDVSFVGVVNADGEAGYDLWVGGGLSTNPMLAQRIGVFVRPDQVTDVWAALHLGLPRLRLPPAAQPRPDEVPHGRLGPGEVPPGAAGRVPARALPDGPAPAPPSTTSATTSAS